MSATMTTYNGWKNRQTWNVALWIGNDESLYRGALAFVRNRKEAKKPVRYRQFVEVEGLAGDKTPDGVAWDGKRLDYKALDAMLAELTD